MSAERSLEQVEVDVKKAVRMLLKEGVKFVPSELMKRNEVLFAASRANERISSESLKFMLYPFIDCRDWIWDEYRERETWTIDEAASLSVGMDPVMFNYEREGYNNDWRESRYQNESKIRDAIHLGRVAVVHDDKDIYLVKESFLLWALKNDLLNMDFAEPVKNHALMIITGNNKEKPSSVSIGVLRARFCDLAYQSYIAKSLSTARIRKNALYEFAILLKKEQPNKTREMIAKEIFSSVPEDYRGLPGFKNETIRVDLNYFDKSIEHPTHRSLEFLNSIPSAREIESSDPTHQWWNQWKSVIAVNYPDLDLPD